MTLGFFKNHIIIFRHEVDNFDDLSHSKTNIKWLFPLCCCPAYADGMSVLDKCKFGALQYTIIRIVTSLIAL